MKTDCIYNMDALEGMRRMPDASVGCCVTSPPYNFCLRVRDGKYISRSPNDKAFSGAIVNKYTNGLTDSLGMDEYFHWQSACIDEMLRVSTGVVFYNIQLVTGNKLAVLRLLGKYAENVREVMIWDKTAAEPAMLPRVLNSEYELVVAFDHGDCKARQFRTANFKRGSFSNVLRIGKNRENDHRAAFPVALPMTLICNFTNEGETVLDPFMGSGTTAVAALRLKRHFVGFELDPGYFKNAEERIRAERAQATLF